MIVTADLPHLNVVLNTWLLLYINHPDRNARTLGGLPNDFLTRGAASLLIFDHVICDEDGLATESAMPWVSSHIFNALHAAGLLRPARLRLHYSDSTLERLRETGLIQWAQSRMTAELARIENGHVSTLDLTLPPALRWLNSVMFTGVEIPNALHYDYHENHFSNLSLFTAQAITPLAPKVDETQLAEDRAVRAAKLLAVLDVALPDFQLLPSISSRVGKRALYENIRDEKRMMYRYIYGAITHPEYENFRSGADFQRRDKLVDNKERFKQADRNLEVLFRVREATKDIRPLAQKLIAAVVDGHIQLEEVQKELNRIRSVIDHALLLESKLPTLRVFTGLKALLGAGETIAAVHEPAAGLQAMLAFAEAYHHWREANELGEFPTKMRREYPLAWIAGVHRRELEQSERKRDSRRSKSSDA